MELRMEADDEQAALLARIAQLERQVAEMAEWLSELAQDMLERTGSTAGRVQAVRLAEEDRINEYEMWGPKGRPRMPRGGW
jgi:hypothetical protein